MTARLTHLQKAARSLANARTELAAALLAEETGRNNAAEAAVSMRIAAHELARMNRGEPR